MKPLDFWEALEQLVASSSVVIDRPKGSAHPRYPEVIYPLDYGYLKDTRSGDGDGIDCWLGSLPERRVTGVVYTVDTYKRDMEAKILLGCTSEERQIILATHRTGSQAATLVER
jgi:inorganic pyrophosphatase